MQKKFAALEESHNHREARRQQMGTDNAHPPGIMLMIQELKADTSPVCDISRAIADFQMALMSQTCTYCDGIGHHAGECPALKKTDKAFNKNPLFKQIWGTAKSLKRYTKHDMIAEKVPGFMEKHIANAGVNARRRGGGFIAQEEQKESGSGSVSAPGSM